MTNNLLEKLKNFGFSGNTAIIYVKLTELGKVRAADLIEGANMHRHLVYRALHELEGRGLVTKTMQNGVAHFTANEPDNLLLEIDQKKKQVLDIMSLVRDQKTAANREVVFYDGLDGIGKASMLSLEKSDDKISYVLGGNDLTKQPVLADYWKEYHTERSKRGIVMKMLFDATTDKEILKNRNAYPFTEARYLPKEMEIPMWIYIYGKMVVLEIPSGSNPLAIAITSEEMTKTFITYFEHLWKNSTPLKIT
jgi:sugar-specific transcriptional regulator TrmB